MANHIYEILPPPSTESDQELSDGRESLFRRTDAAPNTAKDSVMPGLPYRYGLARLFSLVLLLALAYALCRGAEAAYYSISDSFLAPLVLSPDSDLVVPSKLSLSSLVAERKSIAVRLAADQSAMQANGQAIARLEELKQAVARGLDFASAVTSHATRAGTTDLRKLSRQRELLEQSIGSQERYVEEMKRNLAAGLVHRVDLVHEQNELGRMQLLALQNDRDRLTTETRLHESTLAQSSLDSRAKAPRMLTPEMLEQREQFVRIELELFKLEGDQRVKATEITAAQEEIARLDALLAQIKARPIFRAVEAQQNVAFVPYTQFDGVAPQAAVYECRLWGLLACERVGSVIELLPGEISTQDPWGSPARGQYALLKLSDPCAARAKVLRVRHASGGRPAFLRLFSSRN